MPARRGLVRLLLVAPVRGPQGFEAVGKRSFAAATSESIKLPTAGVDQRISRFSLRMSEDGLKP